MKKRFSYGELLVFIGAVLWSLNSPIVKFLPLDSCLICGLRAIIAGLVLLPFVRIRKLHWNWWMVVYLIAYAALSLTIILALQKTSAPVAIGMQYTATVWLFLANWIATREFNRNRFIPVVIIMVGVVFFMSSGMHSGTTMQGNLIAATEGVSFAFMTVGAKRAGGDNPIGLTSIANLFTGVMMMILFPSAMAGVFHLNKLNWILMLVLGVVQLGIGYAFYNAGVSKIAPQRASILALWEMILGPCWVAIFLHEYPSVAVIIGFVIVIIGLVLDTLLPNYPTKKGQEKELEKTAQQV